MYFIQVAGLNETLRLAGLSKISSHSKLSLFWPCHIIRLGKTSDYADFALGMPPIRLIIDSQSPSQKTPTLSGQEFRLNLFLDTLEIFSFDCVDGALTLKVLFGLGGRLFTMGPDL